MLLDLPTEILLSAIAQGLGPRDALSLASTCRSLHEICYSLPVWLNIAQTISQIHPLPLPAFKTLDTLSLPELVAVCGKHTELLESTSRFPMLEPRHCRLEISGQGLGGLGGVHHFAFLPGGRYLIILHVNGVFTCWDILQGTGVRLVEFVTGGVAVSWNFQTDPNTTEAMVVLVTMRLGTYQLDILRLEFSPDEVVQLTLTKLATVPAPFECVRIHIQDNLICSSGASNGGTLLLFVLDPIDNRQVLIDTTISEKPEKWDSFTHLPYGIMLYREDQDRAHTFWYDDARTLLETKQLGQPDAGSAWSRTIRRPDGSKIYNFDDDCVLSAIRQIYFVGHPWNTPIRSRDKAVSIISFSQGEGTRPGATQLEIEQYDDGHGSYPTHRTITQYWLNSAHLVSSLPPSEEESPLPSQVKDVSPPLRRWIHHIPFDGLASNEEGNDLISIGSHGTHLVWIWEDTSTYLKTGQWPNRLRLSIATLLPTGRGSERDYPSEAVIRGICVDQDGTSGIDFTGVRTMDMEDSHGIIGLAMYPEVDSAPDGTDLVYVHLLYL
ncbi:hypothetical protein FRB95_008063 [Tulasnella sp. JGI-2019a]|nr:hypothetical protein FRB93_002816 [Tulasnella sp. JGI-2019a]KAG9036732.1 hypothetical protein FRB95_008063 [Tulasnella sp. JGI-2019a]